MTPFLKHLERMREIHDRKSRDYSSSEDRFVNYHRQRVLMDWFDHPQDKVYAARIGEKLSRLATLRNKEYHAEQQGQDRPSAANEPLDDSFLDLCTISNIWWSDYEGGYRAAAHHSSGQDGDEAAGPGLYAGEGSAIDDKSGAAPYRYRGPEEPGDVVAGRPEKVKPPTLGHRQVIEFVDWLRDNHLPTEEIQWLYQEVSKARDRVRRRTLR